MTDWIFGYGSLVWRPAFAHVRRVPARLDGWKRRFWQGSPDHRGVPEAPGRVVTLLPDPAEHTWGMAYQVAPEALPEVLATLDVREIAGYERHLLPLSVEDGAVRTGLVYVATADNPQFLGPAPIREMASHILHSHGPSGPNREYLLQLWRALTDLDRPDPHVDALAHEVLRLETNA